MRTVLAPDGAGCGADELRLRAEVTPAERTAACCAAPTDVPATGPGSMVTMTGAPPPDGPQPASSDTDRDSEQVRLTAWVHGMVQGVGFRWWTRAAALELGLVGTAANLPDGRVEVVAEGPRAACELLLQRLQGGRTPGFVEQVVAQYAPARGNFQGFRER